MYKPWRLYVLIHDAMHVTPIVPNRNASCLPGFVTEFMTTNSIDPYQPIICKC